MDEDTTIAPDDSPETSHLVSFGPRDTRRAFEHSLAYSRIVSLLRWALPVLVLVTLSVLIAWPFLSSRKIKNLAAGALPDLVVENLHLTGVDAQNQSYTLTADKALQAVQSNNLIDLEKPQGDITLNSGAWLAGKAQYGRYDQSTRNLWLGGNVQLFHDRGYQFTTSEAQVDLRENTAWGDQPVKILGSFGEITGEGFRVLDRGNVVVIKGHALASLNLQTASLSDKKKKASSVSPRQGRH